MSVYFWRVDWNETEPLSTYGRTLTEGDARIVALDPEPACSHEWLNVQDDVPERFEWTEKRDTEASTDDRGERATCVVFEVRFKCLECGADRVRALPYPS